MELCYQSGSALVYSVEDWKKLRTDYRIVGSFVGSTSPAIPALPLTLLPEEVSLLVNKGIAKLVRYPNLQDVGAQRGRSQEHTEVQASLLEAQREVYRENRKQFLESILDKIVEGKQLKHDGEEKTREEIFQEELNKHVDLSEEAMVWPIPTESPKSVLGPSVDIPLSCILNRTTSTKCAVFADLWEKGHYITSGFKFGGDFLVYLGDPLLYHAAYIVRCVEDPSRERHTSEIVAFGRLGNSVKKKSVLAAVNKDGSVSYITLSWLVDS